MAKKPAAPDPEKPVQTALPGVDAMGRQLAEDGLPLAPVHRAMALAEAGEATDPLGLVEPEHIAAHDPVAAEADKEAALATVEVEAPAPVQPDPPVEPAA